MNLQRKKQWMCLAVCLALCVILALLPTGFEGVSNLKDGNERVAARVLSVDNSLMHSTGLVQSGEQTCRVELLQGSHKGESYTAANLLSGSLEQDKVFQAGDLALVLVSSQNGTVRAVSTIDHYRIHLELLLGLAFLALLVLFAGATGLRAAASFLLTLLMIWKVLVPACLQGANPIWIGLSVMLLLTLAIIALVFGFDRRCLAACVGAGAGLLVTCGLGMLCTNLFQIHGAVMAFSESLLYSGYQDLDLTRIFMASIFVGSSGAMMDLTVDIAAAVHEVVEKRPDLSRREAAMSGIRVGRAAMGTMTTTLLLAYSGGFLGLLMVFMAQGTPLINILNYKYVASEMIHTVVGSFGLVAAAPLTALSSGFFLATGSRPDPAEAAPSSCGRRRFFTL